MGVVNVDDTVKRVHRAIEIHSRKNFHVEQFEVKGKQPGKGPRKRDGRRDEDGEDASASA